MQSLNDLIQRAKTEPTRTIAVANGADGAVLQALAEACEADIVRPLLFGVPGEIEQAADAAGVSLNGMEIEACESPLAAARNAVQAVSAGRASMVMKGLVNTDDFLRAILNRDWGLRTGAILSHVALFDIPGHDRLLMLTDAAMNMEPDLDQKVHILQNAAALMRPVLQRTPKIAMLAHSEKVMPDNRASAEAALIATMGRRGQLGDVIVDGPLALDVAVSAEAAAHKGIDSPVAGAADIVVCPGIQSGNALYKSLTRFARARCAALIAGAAAPVVLTSRADDPETKFLSVVFAAVTA